MRDPVLASACAGCDDGPASTCSRMLTDMFGRRMMALLLPTGLTLSVCRPRDPSHENAGNMPSSNVVMHIDGKLCMKGMTTVVGYSPASWDDIRRQNHCPIGVLAEWSNA